MDDESPATKRLASDSLYLETVDRSRLDFDFEKVCSVSLSNNNVYACLSCGKYFQGRGKDSCAYAHSLEEMHHVYINLDSLRVYVLPEGYEVVSSSLNDIKHVISPKYTYDEVRALKRDESTCYDLAHKQYKRGFIGMNNTGGNSYLIAVILMLSHVPPLRDEMLLHPHRADEVLRRTSLLMRKLWNNRSFKSHVSPHDILQQLRHASRNVFKPGSACDPFDFLNWFLNYLHVAMGGSRSVYRSSLVQNIFQGKVRIESQKISHRAAPGNRLQFDLHQEVEEKTVPFLFLSFDLPPAPLFQEELQKNLIPQVSLTTLLHQYDGSKAQELAGQRKRYRICDLGPYVIMRFRRYARPDLVKDRNPTIVTFPTENLDLGSLMTNSKPILYRLIGNIVHDPLAPEKDHWKVQLLDQVSVSWSEIQDLTVQPIRHELLVLAESYIQLWERQDLVT